MNTQLVEIANSRGNLLRGILTTGETPTFGVVMIGGFERSATTEKKFKRLAEALAARGGACLRFDAAGYGLSDGDYGDFTVAATAEEFVFLAARLRQHFGLERIVGVGHSLGACVVASAWEKAGLDRAVLIAPALDQASILRYFFMKQAVPGAADWARIGELVDESLFAATAAVGFTTATTAMGPAYFTECAGTDFRPLIAAHGDRALIAYGDADQKVPIASLGPMPGNRLIVVPGGDHDLERPGQFEQWFDQAVTFLTA